MDIVDLQELEDIVNTDANFHVWLIAHDITSFWELEQNVIIEILGKERIVLVSQFAIHASETDVFTPLEMLKERNTVEYLSVLIP